MLPELVSDPFELFNKMSSKQNKQFSISKGSTITVACTQIA